MIGKDIRVVEAGIEESIRRVCQWVEDHKYQGYEPFDGLLSYLRTFAFGNQFAERLLIQLVRQSPVNLRPLLGIRPTQSTTGMAYLAHGYLKMYQRTGDVSHRDKAARCLQWVAQNKSPHYAEYCWGNRFDFTSRAGRLPRLEPTIVWSSLIGQVFLDSFAILHDDRYLHICESVCAWILKLPREMTRNGACVSYVAFTQESVHNSNMLGAAMLARTANYTGNKQGLAVAKQAMEYSCSRQRPDGSWSYGEQNNMQWIDSFHTCYNLDSLKCYIESTSDTTYELNLRRGFQFFKKTFLAEDGTPKYYHNRTYPVDIQCASQAIDTLVRFSQDDNDALDLAVKVAQWAIENMQDSAGYFYYRVLPLKSVRIPMLHWGQATMFKALTSLLSKISQDQHSKSR